MADYLYVFLEVGTHFRIDWFMLWVCSDLSSRTLILSLSWMNSQVGIFVFWPFFKLIQLNKMSEGTQSRSFF